MSSEAASVRVAAPAAAPARLLPRRFGRRLARRLPAALGATTVALQVAYPLVPPGGARDALTVGTVVAFASASAAHAALTRGPRAAFVLLALAGGGGFAVEVLGVRTGVPFGHYAYDGSLGVRWLGVPPVVGLAWAMMAWPALLAGRRLTAARRWATPLVAGWALASWDVFLDPQMVTAGHWTWSAPGVTLPGVADVPLTNFAGWAAVAALLMAALDRAVPRPPTYEPADDTVPLGLYLWTYGSSLLANVAFFHRPGVAATGGLAMGAVVAPLVWRLWRRG